MNFETSHNNTSTTLSASSSFNHSRHVVRWYIMVYPISSNKLIDGIEKELFRRRKDGEQSFEYFAPTFVQIKQLRGKKITVQHPLFMNYFFIHASESEIYRFKKYQPQYNFLPRVNIEDDYYYPYISDSAINTLKWIAQSYSGTVPVCEVSPEWLVKGDKIRITQGEFKGIEAHIVALSQGNKKEIVVSIDNWMCVPLMSVKKGDYEIIELDYSNRHSYNSLSNIRFSDGLHEALCRHIKGEATLQDKQLAIDALNLYASLMIDSNVMRCKLYSLMLPAYCILGNKEKMEGLISLIRTMLPIVKAEQSLALLYVSLYGCTDNSQYYDKAHAIIDQWGLDDLSKKSKLRLINRLKDYDLCLNH